MKPFDFASFGISYGGGAFSINEGGTDSSSLREREVHWKNGRFVYIPTIYYSAGLHHVLARFGRGTCPECGGFVYEYRTEKVCGTCGLIGKIGILEPDKFYYLVEENRKYVKRMKDACRQILWMDEPIVGDDVGENYMRHKQRKLASEFIDYRILTLLKGEVGGLRERDIPQIYKSVFSDNGCPAEITREEVREAIKRLQKKGRVEKGSISTPQGKRNVIRLVGCTNGHQNM